jgi:hypothetical protein
LMVENAKVQAGSPTPDHTGLSKATRTCYLIYPITHPTSYLLIEQ